MREKKGKDNFLTTNLFINQESFLQIKFVHLAVYLPAQLFLMSTVSQESNANFRMKTTNGLSRMEMVTKKVQMEHGSSFKMRNWSQTKWCLKSAIPFSEQMSCNLLNSRFIVLS